MLRCIFAKVKRIWAKAECGVGANHSTPNSAARSVGLLGRRMHHAGGGRGEWGCCGCWVHTRVPPRGTQVAPDKCSRASQQHEHRSPGRRNYSAHLVGSVELEQVCNELLVKLWLRRPATTGHRCIGSSRGKCARSIF